MSTTAQLHDDVARYRGALLALDPGMPREQWVRAAMAAKAAGIAFSDFDDWSALAANDDGGTPPRRGSRFEPMAASAPEP